MTSRTPKGNRTSSCVKCVQPDNKWMTQCDDRKCNSWAHNSCLGVNEKQARELEWYCNQCEVKRQAVHNRCEECKNLVVDPVAAIYCDTCNAVMHSKCAGFTRGFTMTADKAWTCGTCSKTNPILSFTTVVVREDDNETQFRNEQENDEPQPTLLTNVSQSGATRRISSRRSEVSFRSAKSATEVNSLKQAKIDNLREQRRLIKLEAELLKQENELIDQQLENMTIVSSEINDDRKEDFDENPMLNRYVGEQAQQNRALTKKNMGVEQTVRFKTQIGPQHAQASDANENAIDRRDPTVNLNQWTARQSMGRELPSFTGRPEEWPSFIAAYENSTEVCGFSDQENLVRLQKAIKHPARALVESLMYSPSCVSRIVSTLRRMFAQPNQLFNSYLEKFKREPSPREDKPESLMVYAAAVQNLWAVIQSTHLESHMSNPFVMEVLIEKLPQSLRYHWDTYVQGKKNDMNTFVDWLDELSDRVCRVNPNMNLATFTMKTNRPLEELAKKGARRDAHIHYHDSDRSPKREDKCAACDQKCKSLPDCCKFLQMKQELRWDLIRSKGICKQCLRKHILRPPYHCTSRIRCEEPGCNARHHKLIHRYRIEQKLPEEEPKAAEEPKLNHHASDEQLLFRYVRVRISVGSEAVNVGAFLDEGSSGTFMDDDLAKLLKASGPTAPLRIHYTSNNYHSEDDSMRISVTISGTDEESRQHHLKGVQTVKDLNLSSQSLDYESLSARYPHLRSLPVKSYQGLKPKLLIGLNNWSLGIPTEVKLGNPGDPIAAQCQLGWTIFASQKRSPSQNIHYCNFIVQPEEKDERLDELMKRYYSLDSLGVRQPLYDATSSEDKRALRLMNDTVQNLGDRYEVGLLWQHDNVQLPESHGMALRRMQCLEARLRKDADLAKAVEDQIHNLIEKGYARKVEPMELKQVLPRKWYLPVFPVVNVNKPGKVRLVFDAAARVGDVSLNSTLLKGPDQNSTLIGVLMRFRQRRVGIAGDIREMFMQVRIRRPDCYSQLFLYRQNQNVQPETYILESMTFGATCSPTCAQFVKNCNAEKYQKEYPRAVESVIRNHYVDDLLDSVDTVQEAIELIEQVKYVHSGAGFEIRGWKCNSPEVMSKYGEAEDKMSLQIDPEDDTEKVLGMWWRRSTDEFTYSLKFNKGNQQVLAGKEKPTKREMLRILMSLYDPLGLLTHFTSILKVLMQDVWRSGIGWDEVISDETFIRWCRWLKMLWQVEHLSIPRCYLESFERWTEAIVQLHVFVDASEDCCAAVAYLRTQSEDVVEVSLVMAKSKVAPIKLTSIPRLELVAALLGARLSNTIKEALSVKIHGTYFWTDSTTVLSWIKSDTKSLRGHQYERFRAAEIQDTTSIADWRYVPSRQNVADDATKINSADLTSQDRFFHGPPFLRKSEDQWPSKVTVKEAMNVEEVHAVALQKFEPVIQFERYSDWDRLVRVVVVIRRYIRILKSRCDSKQGKSVVSVLPIDDFKGAEMQLFRAIQLEAYPREITMLSKVTSPIPAVVDKKSEIRGLTPILKDDLLRVGGRTGEVLKESPYSQHDTYERGINDEIANPIILHKKHPGTALIVQKYHQKYWHINHDTVANEIRQRFYISGLRQLIKNIRRKCPRCTLLNAKANPPKMANLPYARLATHTRPFTYTGVDVMGPFNVTVRRRPEKRWICLFTCLTTRAVHLEVLHGMDHDSFILAFRCFTARRGQPREMFSDNGTNFVKAERILREEMKQLDTERIEKTMAKDGIKWHFNPPDASHMGGSWERLVKSVKIAYYIAMPKRSISDQLLRSLMAEIENMINSRPLTYISIESETQEALTPNHFLLQSSSGMKPLGQFRDDATILKSNWLNSQLYTKKFWNRWISEYLPELTCRSKWFFPVEPLQEGDLVLIVDETKHNYDWQRGLIHRVNKASDGQVRSVIVKTSTGFLTRPAVKIAKLNLERSGSEDESLRPPGGSVKNVDTSN